MSEVSVKHIYNLQIYLQTTKPIQGIQTLIQKVVNVNLSNIWSTDIFQTLQTNKPIQECSGYPNSYTESSQGQLTQHLTYKYNSDSANYQINP